MVDTNTVKGNTVKGYKGQVRSTYLFSVTPWYPDIIHGIVTKVLCNRALKKGGIFQEDKYWQGLL
jgi:hypothetical protein